jgi:hypothetical protein
MQAWASRTAKPISTKGDLRELPRSRARMRRYNIL